MKYDNYIFDLYGTLADIHTNESKPYLWKKCAAILTELGFPYDPHSLRADYHRFIEEETRHMLESTGSGPDIKPEIDLRKVFRKLMSPWMSDEQIDLFAITFRVLSRDKLTLYPEVPAIFDAIHEGGGRVYLLSNAQSCFTLPEIKVLGIYDMFDDIFISSDMGCAKPDVRFMNMLIRKHKLDTGRSVMIGNDYNSDIKIANKVGMDSLYIETETSPVRIPTKKIGATYADLTHRQPRLEYFKENLI
ncbi:MAG: HAD family hydrolase [Lachnospiraceae bacterium]|nr:HAD family hydrolase [Lachnospiraceae bacterium]